MDYNEQFKKNFIGSTFKLAFSSWFKITLAYLITYVLTLVIFLLVLSSILGGLSPLALATAKGGLFGVSSIPMGLFSSVFQLITVLTGSVIFSLLIASWYYNFAFASVRLKVEGIRASFGKVFIKSLNSGVFKILLINLIYFALTFILLAGGFHAMRISFWAIIPVLLLYVFIVLKTILVIPSYVIGKKAFLESFNFSFTHITILRALKIFLGVIVLFAVLFGVSLLLQFLPAYRPTTMSAILILIAAQQLVYIIIYGYMGALFISAVAGLYYRYSNDIVVAELKKDKVFEEVQEKDINNDDDEPYDMSKNLFA